MSKQAMPIDTQQVVEKLTGAGVPDRQARAHASVLNEALQDYELRAHDQFVSRQDLTEALMPIHQALAVLNAKLDLLNEKMDAKIDAALAKVKSEVALWIASAGLFQTSIIAALILELAN